MKASTARPFAVITWKCVDPPSNRAAFGTYATCGHGDPDCPRITAKVVYEDGSVDDLAAENEFWDGECIVLDPIVCPCAK